MSVGRIVDGRHVGGRLKSTETPETHPHHFRALAKYLGADAPLAPMQLDYSALSAAVQEDILGNDYLGDCTCAALLHFLACVRAIAGAPVVFTRADAVLLYQLAAGYDPNAPLVDGQNPTDRGAEEVTILSFATANGIDGHGAHKLAGWVNVDASNKEQVKRAIYLFGGAYLCGELEDAWTRIAGDGLTWDTVGAPDPDEGHAVALLGYDDDKGVLFNSWGRRMWLTWRALAEMGAQNGGTLGVLLTPEIVNAASKRCPAGADYAQLVTDFEGLGGTILAPVAA